MAAIFTIPFASSGDTNSIPSTVQGNGSISFPSGWGLDYEKANGDANYKPVGRRDMNQLFKLVTEAIQEMQYYGYAQWQSITGGWPQYARVMYNGTIYRSTSNGNTSTPPAGNWVPDIDFTPYINKNGSVAMTAPLVLSGNVSGNLHAVPYQQVLSMMNQAVPAGLVAYWPSSSALPAGWANCNGGAYQRTGTYANLYAVIGTTFGNTSGSDFKTPDLRGRFLRVWDEGKGVDNGRSFGSEQSDQNKQHNHGGATGGQSANHTHGGYTDAQGNHQHYVWAMRQGALQSIQKDAFVGGNNTSFLTDPAGNHQHNVTTYGASNDHTHSIQNDGGSESRPVNTALRAIIKY